MLAHISPSTRVALVLGAVLATGACARSDREAAGGDTTPTVAAAPGDSAAGAASGARTDTGAAGGAVTGGAAWSDAQIFGMLSAANTGEIATGKLAQTRATGAQVKAFARRTVTDHTAMEKQGSDLAKRLNVTPAMPPDSALITDVNDDVEDLQKKERGADWDEDYIEKQIDAHQKTLDLIDRANNSTQNAEIKQLLQQARPKVQAHLDEARRLKDTKTS